METKISEEEFMRLQNQLIELRTANYALEEQNAAHKVKNKETSARLEMLEKEYNKLNSSLSSFRQMKNVDLYNRNEALQLKLQAQEDDFRLQNATLLKELALLDAENKKLQSRVSANELEIGESAEVKKLKEEASALQRVLSEERLRSASEINKLRAALNLLIEDADEEIRSNLCPVLEGEVFKNTTGVESECDDSSEKLSVGIEEAELLTSTGGEIESSNSQQTSVKTKEELEILKSKWGVDVEILADLIKNRKDKYESLKTELTALDGRFAKFRSLSDQMIHDLEKLLADTVEEVNVLKQEKSDLEVQIIDLKKQLSEKFAESDIVYSQLAESAKNLEKMKSFAENLKNENSSLVESVDNLRMGLLKKNELIEEVSAKYDQLELKYNDLRKTMEKDQESSEKELKEILGKMQELQEKYNSLEECKDREVKEFTQKLFDLNADRALYEKKNSVICRDLKRQLALERRRAEKLQEKLRDFDVSSIKQESSKVGDVEVTSVSSWSLMSGNMEPQELSTQESTTAGSPVNINGNVEEMDLEQENKNLLERLTTLQEEKWLLEEQVNHLEQGSAAMAEDLMKKAELIKFYCMDIRPGEHQLSNSGKKGVRRLSEFLKGSEGESMQESHARMQRMLEETLTKNMYLQRDIEHLSTELETVRLSCNKPLTEK